MGIKDIDPTTLKDWIAEGKAILVDVREAGERAVERISDAHHLPLSAFNPDALPSHDDKIVVYHCASGGRTRMYGPQLREVTASAADVYHLAGGIGAWKMAGFATE
ncbi:MAG: rhodanese-like domain-containing protein [Rhodospirillaceae bacterium]|jgi:rhodanese-related sulfurtransferase|nr:rhodanese-like domain-containing protein [Rhodospirillaceae bacterium]MBT4219385.1 rhodanese-like domain-containing protein [Rhodospirillaceae bacterium]MBT4464297.1 rhodanese-like domain-containing protein [Rhodospirillaceae bacterium]MBT5014073.1 rhodanese-like domain-containing protein [Rhodospirillaceae bacterium]MBT5308702.1 rhodanese-like domain-containing protein [Rhodospirillaceae bacterium]